MRACAWSDRESFRGDFSREFSRGLLRSRSGGWKKSRNFRDSRKEEDAAKTKQAVGATGTVESVCVNERERDVLVVVVQSRVTR